MTEIVLWEKLESSIISRNCDNKWPPKGCDLLPFDSLLCACLKSFVFKNKPNSLEALWDNAIHETRIQLMAKVLENWIPAKAIVETIWIKFHLELNCIDCTSL